eukprot:UC4_evm1s106
MIACRKSTSDPPPQDLSHSQISLLPGVIVDAVVGNYGDVVTDAAPKYTASGKEIVVTKFKSACPRNDMRLEDTFLTVERLDEKASQWIVIATDSDPETRFIWKRDIIVDPRSYATITWAIPSDAMPGQYRIKHFGTSKSITGTLKAFEGTSRIFQVLKSNIEN